MNVAATGWTFSVNCCLEIQFFEIIKLEPPALTNSEAGYQMSSPRPWYFAGFIAWDFFVYVVVQKSVPSSATVRGRSHIT